MNRSNRSIPSTPIKSVICQLLAQKSLSEDQSYALFSELDKASESQQSAILALLAAKGVTFDELMGARAYFMAQSTIEPSVLTSCPADLVDLVGTGGDGKGTFNISTAASLVVASCGVDVVKHGGGRVTSRSGSADMMTALGVPLYFSFSKIIQSLQQHHYAYICAPYFNQALKTFGPIRSQLGFPTIFNVLGPVMNPLRPKRQVIGVYRPELVPIVAALLQATGSTHALVLYAEEGLDELSVSGPSRVAQVSPDGIQEYRVSPEKLGFPKSTLQDVLGDTPEANALIIQSIFSGQLQGAKLNIVLLNAAAGLLVASRVTSLAEGVEMAREAIVSGRTIALLHRLQQGNKI